MRARLVHGCRCLAVAVAVLGLLLSSPVSSYAQHGNYLLGSLGLLGGAQAPEGIYYQNIFSYYNASGSATFDASRTRTLEAFGRQLELLRWRPRLLPDD